MYVKVIKKNVVRKPPSKVFRNQKPKVMTDGYIYWDKSDPIPRDNKWKYDFIICESYRENGKVKTKQKHIGTVRYWDIVDGWGHFVFECNIEKHFSDDDELYSKAWELIEEKYNPIEQQILTEYEKTEEYKVREYWRKEEKRVSDEIQEQREREEAEKREQEEESKWQYYKSYYRQYSASISTGIVLKNKELANELIKAGFKQLSKKYHPDCSGTDGQFKELNNLKEQLDKFVK